MTTAATDQLHEAIAAYNDAWNAHDLERIRSLHASDMVFENHTAGERAEGEEAIDHIAGIFDAWPDIAFTTRRLYVRGPRGPGVDRPGQPRQAAQARRHRGPTVRAAHRVGRDGRDPVRERQGQTQGRLLGFSVDPAPSRATIARRLRAPAECGPALIARRARSPVSRGR